MSEMMKIQEAILTRIVQEIRNVVGVEAIVLGGSRVNGTFSGTSNIDVGLYYFADGVLDIETLNNNKYKYLKLCLDPETEREVKKVHKRAIIFSIAITIVAVALAVIMIEIFM